MLEYFDAPGPAAPGAAGWYGACAAGLDLDPDLDEGFTEFAVPAAARTTRSSGSGNGAAARGTGGAAALRVIHVGQFMFRAGIETWLKSLLQYADRSRLQFQRCVVTSPVNDVRVMREIDVPVEVGGRESVRRAARDCDVLLVSGPGETAEWLGEIRPRLCVFIAHGDGPWTQDIFTRSAGVFDHVIAVSEGVKAAVCKGIPGTVIYNGADIAHVSRSQSRLEIRSRYGFDDTDFVVGSVLRYSSEKRPETLIEAVAQLPKRFKLLLVGWGPLRQQLFDLANRLIPGRCVLVRADANLGDFYQAMDAFCLASQSEGFGLATLEALLCGLPVVSARTGFVPELLVDRVHCVLTDRDGPSLAAALRLIADHPDWAAGLAREGRRRAESFGFASRMCREYEQLLHRLWKERQVCVTATGPGR
jgi:glycosyltransferase involved in cell wall biosynthesis